MFDPEYFSIENLIKTGLPPLPASVVRVSALLSDMNVSQTAIANALSLDPILSSRILRLANSPIYALHGTVTNLASAVATVGNMAISEAMMISGISDSFGRKILRSAAGKEIWFHSLATAMAASEICRLAQMRGADEAFSCGLLHDIGKLILLRADYPFYIEIMARATDEVALAAVEREVFGFDHAELGTAAAIGWKLPAAVSHMIRFHHEPSNATAGIAMAHIINIADTLVTLKMADAEMDELLISKWALAFRIEVSQFEMIWDTISPRLDEVVQTFS